MPNASDVLQVGPFVPAKIRSLISSIDIRRFILFESCFRCVSRVCGEVFAKCVAPVLRMLSNYVGEQAFLEGVTLYLKGRLYGNSVSRDLWDAIGQVTGTSPGQTCCCG